jgi:hypothetical protein
MAERAPHDLVAGVSGGLGSMRTVPPRHRVRTVKEAGPC